MSADAGFLCDKAAVLGETINATSFTIQEWRKCYCLLTSLINQCLKRMILTAVQIYINTISCVIGGGVNLVKEVDTSPI